MVNINNKPLSELLYFLQEVDEDRRENLLVQAANCLLNPLEIMAKLRSSSSNLVAPNATKNIAKSCVLPTPEPPARRSRSSTTQPPREKEHAKASASNPNGIKKTKAKVKPAKASKMAELYKQLKTTQWTFPHAVSGSPYLEVDATECRGRSIRTTVPNIPAGTIIMMEHPLINRFKLSPSSTYDERLEKLVDSMNDEDRELFAQLSYTESIPSWAEARVKPNSFDVLPEHLSVYRYISFMNHSCKPNCRLENGTTHKDSYIVRTLFPINEVGTHITIDYKPEDRLLQVEDRQEGLEESWQFTCDCAVCSSPDITNAARDQIRTLQKELKCRLSDYSPKELPTLATVNEHMEQYISLLREHHLLDGVPQAHQRAIQVLQKSTQPRDSERVLEHWRRLMEVQHSLEGAESSVALVATEKYLEALKAWRKTRREIVGTIFAKSKQSGKKRS